MPFSIRHIQPGEGWVDSEVCAVTAAGEVIDRLTELQETDNDDTQPLLFTVLLLLSPKADTHSFYLHSPTKGRLLSRHTHCNTCVRSCQRHSNFHEESSLLNVEFNQQISHNRAAEENEKTFCIVKLRTTSLAVESCRSSLVV